MNHADVRALLEDAAVEPGGLERMTAGDTAEAAAVAGHLAGCPECSREHARVARLASLLSRTIAQMEEEPRIEAPDELRARTLEYVRTVGRRRVAEGATTAEERGVAPLVPAGSNGAAAPQRIGDAIAVAPLAERPIPTPIPAQRTPGSARSGRRFGSLLAIAAALVLAVLGTGLAVRTFDSGQLADTSSQVSALSGHVEALTDITNWSFRVTAQADARSVRLAPASGTGAGVALFSPSSGDVVVLMTGFEPPAAGKEYRCWVSTNGQSHRIGRMFFEGGLGYWVGSSNPLTQIGPGAVFGVTLVDQSSGQSLGSPVLTGTLGA